MSQNLKVILDPYQDDGTLNQVLFNDNIKIKGGSSIALTSFNGSLDTQSIERQVPDEEIEITINKPTEGSSIIRRITIPSANYTSFEGMTKTFQDYLNRACGSIDSVGAPIQTLLGMTVTVEGIDLFKITSAVEISTSSKALTPVPTKQEHLIDEDGYFPEELEIEMQGDLEFLSDSSYLIQGGGFRVQVPVNLRNTTTGSLNPINANTYIRLNRADSKNKDARQHYSIIYVPNQATPGDRRLIIRKLTQGLTTDYIVPSASFYDYQTKASPDGPFTNVPSNGYFFVCQVDGFVKFGYYQTVNSGGIRPNTAFLFDDDLQMIWSDAVKYTVTVNTGKGCKVKEDQYLATLTNSAATTGNSQREKAGVTFDRNSVWKKYLGMNEVNLFNPKNEFSQKVMNTYTPGFFNLEQLEFALEIDSIKINNFVGLKSNSSLKKQGRQNILAYFTPSTSIEGANYIYEYTPPEPIYLRVDAKQDFEINRMGIRLFNTYNGKSIKAHALTFVITNK